MEFWRKRTGVNTISDMRATGLQEMSKWVHTDYAKKEGENGWNYDIVDEKNWKIVERCETIEGKTVKFAQSIRNAGKETFNQGKFYRWVQHNDIGLLKVFAKGIDRYLAIQRSNNERAIGLYSLYSHGNLYALHESIQIMAMNKTPLIKHKNLQNGANIELYISNFNTRNFHSVFIEFISSAIEQRKGVKMTTDDEIAKTIKHFELSEQLKYNVFKEFTSELIGAIEQNNGVLLIKNGLKQYTSDEFEFYTNELEEMLIIKKGGGKITKR